MTVKIFDRPDVQDFLKVVSGLDKANGSPRMKEITHLPHDLPADEVADILAAEKAYSQDLQRQGKWRHIWRIAGQYSNISIFDAVDNAELHSMLSGLPLFKFMQIEVAPLLRHPSAIRTDDS